MKKTNTTMHGDVEVRDALRWIGGILDYSQIPYIVLGEAMKQMVQQEAVNVEKIVIGINKNAWNETTKALIRTFLIPTPFREMSLEEPITLEWNNVPIELKIIKRNYEFFKNPDFVFYWADEYKIPNPWMKYYKSRFLIR